jgi:hypothetical protein
MMAYSALIKKPQNMAHRIKTRSWRVKCDNSFLKAWNILLEVYPEAYILCRFVFSRLLNKFDDIPHRLALVKYMIWDVE